MCVYVSGTSIAFQVWPQSINNITVYHTQTLPLSPLESDMNITHTAPLSACQMCCLLHFTPSNNKLLQYFLFRDVLRFPFTVNFSSECLTQYLLPNDLPVTQNTIKATHCSKELQRNTVNSHSLHESKQDSCSS